MDKPLADKTIRRLLEIQSEFNKQAANEIEHLENLLINAVDFPFKRLHPNAKLPAKAGELEACYDISCVADDRFWEPECIAGIEYGVKKKFMELKPGRSHVFHTGLACAIPKGRALFLWDRSGMGAKKNIHRLAGCLDSSYRGEVLVSLINLSNDTHIIEEGDRIIQGHLALVLPGTPVWVDELPESYRGYKGFGSTGK